RARKGQNGLILDRVVDSRIFDNDFSFLSGWGLALWRSGSNVIARNALDFCVRGYSHGVYNRGQDSAGLLLFEQCSGNLIAENSVTHGGDGLFAFAGEEALGKRRKEGDARGFERRGCNDNRIVGNDFSYAAAHGLELTFSFGNRIEKNRFARNGICGIWGGYSRETLIQANRFEGNGEAGYGLERGGIDIEHGSRNVIRANTFQENVCGIHLWWDPDEGLAALPWAQANGTASSDNLIEANHFEGDKLAVQLRESPRTELKRNTMESVGRELDATEGSTGKARLGPGPRAARPLPPLPGETRPVGAREALRGREKIVVTEWGPWDWAGGPPPERKRKLLRAAWEVTAFAWKTDPRKDVEAWRAEARRAEARGAAPREVPALDFVFGGGGPPGLPADHFGTLARAEVAFPAGKWRLITTSDDGVRVWVDGKRVIDNWTWHGPATDTAVLDFPAARTVPVRVEHFELDGYAILRLQIEPAGD
ncbi:MAG: NosD domain-containing protein, partial [Planctomycetota bacterium]